MVSRVRVGFIAIVALIVTGFSMTLGVASAAPATGFVGQAADIDFAVDCSGTVSYTIVTDEETTFTFWIPESDAYEEYTFLPSAEAYTGTLSLTPPEDLSMFHVVAFFVSGTIGYAYTYEISGCGPAVGYVTPGGTGNATGTGSSGSPIDARAEDTDTSSDDGDTDAGDSSASDHGDRVQTP